MPLKQCHGLSPGGLGLSGTMAYKCLILLRGLGADGIPCKEQNQMFFFVSLAIEGALAGVLYSLIALAFVVIYKASRIINFALGEWLMLAVLLVAIGSHALGLELTAAIAFACAGMFLFTLLFNALVLRHLVGRPLISLLMVTLGVGALIRGVAQFAYRSVPSGISLPISSDPLILNELRIPTDKLIAALIAALTIALLAWFHQRSRTGVALRAIADDQQVAMAVGIDVYRYLLIVWCMAGVICVIGGTLWTFVNGGGFGIGLVGLKIFPIVVIGGLDSIPGTIIAAMLIGVLESIATGYLDPRFGGGCGLLACYLALVAMLFVRPFGLFGRGEAQRP
jgi:branched-chain amino acid transport system permease protein